LRKIRMENPIVEMDGDEMARVVWKWIKEELIEPFVELKTEYYDLSIKSRDETGDGVTLEAARALERVKVGVKCPTITPNEERKREYGLKSDLKSPNATLRARLRVTIFRTPYAVSRVKPLVRGWRKPIVVARHGVGDIYDAVELDVPPGGSLALTLDDHRWELAAEGRRVAVLYSIDEEEIASFARAVFAYALERGMDVWFSAKDTILKRHDGLYKKTFDAVFEEFRGEFEKRGLSYNYFLIDDAYSRALRSEGGFVWALKNYDGDVASDFVITAFSGSIALSVSEAYSPEGVYYAEASHGTVQRHYYRYLAGETPYTNPSGLMLAWAKSLERRALVDKNEDLLRFARALSDSVRHVIDVLGCGTPDIAKLPDPPLKAVSTLEFISLAKSYIQSQLSAEKSSKS